MVLIDGMLLQTTVQDVLLELRLQLHLNGVSLFGIMKDSGDDIMVCCPIHNNGRERNPSCGVHKKTGVVHCFACGYSVTLSEMISNVFGYNDFGIFGKSWLKKNFTSIAIDERKDIPLNLSRNISKEKKIEMTDEEYDKYRYTHPYMYKRGLTDDIIFMYDVGYDKENDMVIFPCRDSNGDIEYTIRRSVDGKRYHYEGGTHKSLYGTYELEHYFKGATDVAICESIFNCLSLVSMGIPALALNGTGSKDQFEQLNKLPVRAYILALDNDEAGIKGTDRLAKALGNTHLIYTYNYSDGRDINDLLMANELDKLICTKHLYKFC